MRKHLLRSLTVQGSIVMFVSWVLMRFEISVGPEEIEPVVESGIVLVGFVMTIYGRLRAKHELHLR